MEKNHSDKSGKQIKRTSLNRLLLNGSLPSIVSLMLYFWLKGESGGDIAFTFFNIIYSLLHFIVLCLITYLKTSAICKFCSRYICSNNSIYGNNE